MNTASKVALLSTFILGLNACTKPGDNSNGGSITPTTTVDGVGLAQVRNLEIKCIGYNNLNPVTNDNQDYITSQVSGKANPNFNFIYGSGAALPATVKLNLDNVAIIEGTGKRNACLVPKFDHATVVSMIAPEGVSYTKVQSAKNLNNWNNYTGIVFTANKTDTIQTDIPASRNAAMILARANANSSINPINNGLDAQNIDGLPFIERANIPAANLPFVIH